MSFIRTISSKYCSDQSFGRVVNEEGGRLVVDRWAFSLPHACYLDSQRAFFGEVCLFAWTTLSNCYLRRTYQAIPPPLPPLRLSCGNGLSWVMIDWLITYGKRCFVDGMSSVLIENLPRDPFLPPPPLLLPPARSLLGSFGMERSLWLRFIVAAAGIVGDDSVDLSATRQLLLHYFLLLLLDVSDEDVTYVSAAVVGTPHPSRVVPFLLENHGILPRHSHPTRRRRLPRLIPHAALRRVLC